MDYLDFDLEIGPKSSSVHPLTLHASPAGTLQASLTYPFDRIVQENYLLKLHQALNAGPVKRRIAPQHEQNVREFGQRLFDALFSGELRALYNASLLEADRQGKGLRIKLRATDPALATLPWEYLYDSLQGEFLCLSALPRPWNGVRPSSTCAPPMACCSI